MAAHALNRARVGPRIAGVVLEEMRRLGATGLVLASPPDAASSLLASWLEGATLLRVPDAGGVADVAGALMAHGASGTAVERLAWRVVAEALAEADGLLPVGTTNKTQLLLDPRPLPARVLPLGDLWASHLQALTGAWALPPVLAQADPRTVAQAENRLRDYLHAGHSPSQVFAEAPDGVQGPALLAALDRAEGRRRGLLVPKLEAWTVGADLAR